METAMGQSARRGRGGEGCPGASGGLGGPWARWELHPLGLGSVPVARLDFVALTPMTLQL